MSLRFGPLVLGSLLAGPLLAHAQLADEAAAPASIAVNAGPAESPDETEAAESRSGSRLVEEIIVTAQKREENLADVPISIAAFSADTLDARGIVDPKDLPLATPGLTIGSQAGFTITYLRGVGSDAFLMADPSVAMYIDGVYFPFAHGLAQNFGAIERVEVLKGPQGTLFGRNAVGGAISVVTRAPDFISPEVSLQTSYGDYNDLQTRAHVNVPVSDNFAFSASAIYSNMDSYLEDATIRGEPLPDENSRGARVKLRWSPVERLDLTLAGFKLKQQGTSTMFATNSDPSLVGQLAGIEAETGYGGGTSAPVYFELDNRVVYGNGTLNLDPFDLKLIASHQEVHTSSLFDFDGSPVPLVSFEAKDQYAKVNSAEFQIVSNDSSWASDKLQWIAGVYYFDSRQGFDPNRLNVAGIDFGLGTILDTPLPGALRTLLSELAADNPALSLLPTGTVTLVGLLDTASIAGFVQGTYHFTDWLSLTAGGRYQNEEREIVESSSNLEQFDGDLITLLDFRRGSDTTESFKPKVSIDLRPLDNTLVYLSWQEAIKSGTFNVINIYAPPAYVKPEELEAFELGVKTQLFDGLVSLTAAVFHYDITNQQVQFVSLLQGGAVSFETAGGARIRGADFDIVAQLLPSLTDGLVLTAGGAVLDAKYTDYTSGSGFDDSTGVFRSDYDFTGNRVVRTPEFSGTVGLSQTLQIPGGPLEIAADVYYNGGFYYLAQNSDFNEEDAYTVIGARISYLYEAWGLRATLFGKNLGDTNYNYGRFTTDFGPLNAKAPPVSYGLRLNWDF